MSTANREEPSISQKPRQLEPGRSSSFASPLVPPTTRGRHARLGQTHGALSQDYHQAKRTSSAFTTDGLAAGDLSMKPVPTKQDRKSTRLNSSHITISYAVFCLKKQ